MDRRTVLLKRFKTAGLLSAVAWTLLAASPASAATVIIYNDTASFLSAVQSSYLEDFNSSGLGAQSGPLNFSSGPYQYWVDVPGDSIYLIDSPDNPGDHALSTSTPDFDITFTFASGTNAVGGKFFPTDAPGNVAPGMITVTLNDGTSQILSDSGTSFSGFLSLDSDISSLTVSTGGATGLYATVDNFYTGSGGGVPEPGSVFLLLGGLTAGAMWLRRRNTDPKENA